MDNENEGQEYRTSNKGDFDALDQKHHRRAEEVGHIENNARTESLQDMKKVDQAGKEAMRSQKSQARIDSEDNFAQGNHIDSDPHPGGTLQDDDWHPDRPQHSS